MIFEYGFRYDFDLFRTRFNAYVWTCFKACGIIPMHLSQQAFAENLLHDHGLDSDSSISKPTPFRSGVPVDSLLPDPKIFLTKIKSKNNFNQSLDPSYGWHREHDQIFLSLHLYWHNTNLTLIQNILRLQNTSSSISKVPLTLGYHFTVTSIYSHSYTSPPPN